MARKTATATAKRVLICWGGWDGHTPRYTADTLGNELRKLGYAVNIEHTLAPLADAAALKKLSLIIPMWTMGQMEKEQWKGLNEAVREGVGVGGVHGGMGDAFRGNLSYQWMCGGQFVGHPHVGDYTVTLADVKSPITADMPRRFPYKSEQYYMIVDPGIKVLAETVYDYDGHKVRMPVVWTKTWGKGRVFYSALGHRYEEFAKYPHVLAMTIRGLVWAAR